MTSPPTRNFLLMFFYLILIFLIFFICGALKSFPRVFEVVPIGASRALSVKR